MFTNSILDFIVCIFINSIGLIILKKIDGCTGIMFKRSKIKIKPTARIKPTKIREIENTIKLTSTNFFLDKMVISEQ